MVWGGTHFAELDHPLLTKNMIVSFWLVFDEPKTTFDSSQRDHSNGSD